MSWRAARGTKTRTAPSSTEPIATARAVRVAMGKGLEWGRGEAEEDRLGGEHDAEDRGDAGADVAGEGDQLGGAAAAVVDERQGVARGDPDGAVALALAD